jgi:hypothetical protein
MSSTEPVIQFSSSLYVVLSHVTAEEFFLQRLLFSFVPWHMPYFAKVLQVSTLYSTETISDTGFPAVNEREYAATADGFEHSTDLCD